MQQYFRGKPSIIPLPPDATVTEQKIVEASYALMYAQVEDPIDKFILAFRFDMGNDRVVTALACGLHPKTIWQREKRIKKILEHMKQKNREGELLGLELSEEME